jgi:hypothetical protein
MATTPNNNVVRGGAMARSLFMSALPVLSSAVSFNQGDLITFDTSAKVLKPAATGAGQYFLGVAVNTVVSGLPKQPYTGTAVDASTGLSDLSGPVFGVVASLYLDTGTSLNPGDSVYISNTDAQHVTTTQGGGTDLAIGIYVGPAITSSAAGAKGDILIVARYGATLTSVAALY